MVNISSRYQEVSLNMNKTTHPIYSNSHPSATENIVIHCFKRREGDTKPTGSSYNLDKV